jgi:O-antigen ligase
VHRRPAANQPLNADHAAWPLWLAFVWLALCLALGGGTRQGLPQESLLQLLALPVLGVGLYRLDWHQLSGAARLGLGLVLGVGLWLFLQQVPLPPDVWASLSGRQALAGELQAAGVEAVWRPLSLDPEATRRAGLALLPPAAVLLWTLGLDPRHRQRLLLLLLFLILACVVLGLAQLAFGPESALRWHEVTNRTEAVGPFANRNHFAALLVVGLVLAGAWLVSGQDGDDPKRVARRLAAATGIAVLLLGLALARSRAGVLLAAPTVLGLGLLAWQARRYAAGEDGLHGHRRWLALAALVGVVLGVQFGFYGLLQRFEKDPLQDQRWIVTQNTLAAASQFGPLGAGAGSFESVYPSVEPVAQLTPSYVNRAHNDWAEWWLEGGVPLAALLAAGVLLFAFESLRAFRLQRHWRPWPAAASLAIWMLLLHSLADYPLRTTGLACIAAVLTAVVLGARRTA